MRELSHKQRTVHERLLRDWRRLGRQPNLKAVAHALGIDYTTLRQHLKALAAKGYLRFESSGKGRSPILELRESLGVPVLGDIPAGPLSEALAHPEAYLQLPRLPEGYFGLYVHGDSMADALQDGDLVLLKKGLPQRSGEICAVRLEGEATLKYLDWEGPRPRAYRLRPHNPGYPVQTVLAQEVAIDGVFYSSLRGNIINLLIQDVPDDA